MFSWNALESVRGETISLWFDFEQFRCNMPAISACVGDHPFHTALDHQYIQDEVDVFDRIYLITKEIFFNPQNNIRMSQLGYTRT
jgi:hypothetical protein